MWLLKGILFLLRKYSSVQLLSRVRLFATPWTAARQASLSITNSWGLLKLMSIVLVMPSSHLFLCPTFNLSQHQGLFQWVSSSHWVSEVLEFQVQHQSFHENLGLISFKVDRLDLLAVQGTLKHLLHHHSSKASIHPFKFLIHPCQAFAKGSVWLLWWIDWKNVSKFSTSHSVAAPLFKRRILFPFEIRWTQAEHQNLPEISEQNKRFPW